MENDSISVTIRINQEDLSRILASFGRHSLNVKEHYSQGQLAEDLKGRYDALIKFLET
jgi:hypothetical protein